MWGGGGEFDKIRKNDQKIALKSKRRDVSELAGFWICVSRAVIRVSIDAIVLTVYLLTRCMVQ